MRIDQIIDGTLKNIFNQNEELYKERIAICKKCKLFVNDKFLGDVCSSALYLNPYTDKVSDQKKPGYIQGCGCVLGSKTRVSEATCPAGKW